MTRCLLLAGLTLGSLHPASHSRATGFGPQASGRAVQNAAPWQPAPRPSPAQASPDSPPLTYQVVYRRGEPTVSVTIVPSRPLAAPVVFVMPRAVPMGYDEQRYDSFVAGLAAGDPTAQALETTREDGPRWTVGRSGQQVARLSYTVDVVAMEQAVTSASDASRVRDGYVGLLGYSIFGYLENHETGSAAVTIDGPPDWPVLTTLDPRVPPVTGRAVANAGDFYALADSQVVMGPRAEFRRVPATVPLVVAVYAEGPVDVDRLGSLAAAAMDRVARYFGATPFRHYTIHQELLRPVSPRHQYGFSMEHLDSSTYYLAMDQGITASSGAADADRVLYNFAHHIAHAWIPKRSYGEGYYPFTWELAPVLDTIWFAEGFGQYAAIVAVAEGEPDPEAYRRSLLDRRFRSVLAAAPRFIRRMGLVELSRVASTRYSNDFRTGRNVFARGGLMAAEMDDRIRSATGGRKSLKDALRALVDWSARERRAFAIDDLPRIFETATGVATGDILARWLEPLE